VKKRTATLYWSLSLLAATAVFVPHPSAAQESLDERVAAVAKSEMLAKGIPSVSVAIMRDGKMLLERAWGTADIEKNLSATTATTYRVGSVTKQFTAALLLKQVERGRLALTDPIGKHLAGLTPEAAAMPIEQLLNHTSGLPRSLGDPSRRFDNLSTDALLAMALRENPKDPGTKFEYSNAGYTVLGVLVQKLYGKPYGAVLHDEIAAPLGLTTLSKCDEPKPDQATGYGLGSRATPGPPPGIHHSLALGADGICATAADLVRWSHALHGGRVLSDASYRAMTTPRGAAIAADYGFGLSVSPAQWGARAISHGGQSLTGHVAELAWYPEHKLAVALLYNTYPRQSGISDLVPRLVLGVPLPPKTSQPAAPAAQPPVSTAPVTPAPRATLAGVYALSAQRSFEVTFENGELYVGMGGGEKQALVFRSGNTYMRETDVITFIVENGTVTGFEVDANGSKRILKKVK
jgi:CubicO group peptidase (beta-lactamase class C family)